MVDNVSLRIYSVPYVGLEAITSLNLVYIVKDKTSDQDRQTDRQTIVILKISKY